MAANQSLMEGNNAAYEWTTEPLDGKAENNQDRYTLITGGAGFIGVNLAGRLLSEGKKVLVFDNLGRDVISSVLRVNDLRGWGVTIHLYGFKENACDYLLNKQRNLNSPRHPIPDVPVVYLMEPTAANLALINQDLSKSLYSEAYINFLSSIPRPLMEDFAAQIAEAGTAESISQVYDQYLNFVVAEPDLFSLGLGKETYWALNSANAKDEEIDTLVERIVSGLFSVVVTMGNC